MKEQWNCISSQMNINFYRKDPSDHNYMKSKPVTSREYKLLLHSEKFGDRNQGADKFSALIQNLAEEMSYPFGEYTEEMRRITWYIDTENRDLYKNNYVLRIRDESSEKGRYKVMLKFRNPDRYISSSKKNTSPMKFESKFEEDILPPFISMFSNSASIKMEELPELKKVNHAIKLFPVLEELELKSKTPLVITSNFKAFEIARWVGAFDMGKKLPVKASLNFWYKTKECSKVPLVSEFSFDYDQLDEETTGENEIESYPLSTVTNAEYFYRRLQTKNNWFMKDNTTTKTIYAYELM